MNTNSRKRRHDSIVTEALVVVIENVPSSSRTALRPRKTRRTSSIEGGKCKQCDGHEECSCRRENTILLNQLGISKMSLGMYDEAGNTFKEALAEVSPSSHKALTSEIDDESPTDIVWNEEKLSSLCHSCLLSTLEQGKMRSICLPNQRPSLFNMANRFKRQEYDEGMRMCSDPIPIHPIAAQDGQDDSESIVVSTIMYNIGQTYVSRYNHKEALIWFRRASVACTCNSSSRRQSISSINLDTKLLHAIGYCYYRQGRYGESMNFYEAALLLLSDNIRKDDEKKCPHDLVTNCNYNCKESMSFLLAATKNAIAVVLFRCPSATNDHKSRSIMLFEESLSIYEKFQTNGNDDSHAIEKATAIVLNNIGRLLYLHGEYVKAYASFDRALSIRRRLYTRTSIDLAVTICNLGQTCHQLSRFDEAMVLFKEFLDTAQNTNTSAADVSATTTTSATALIPFVENYSSHRDVCIIVATVASIHLRRDELEDAKKMFEMALQSGRLAFGSFHVEIASILNKLGAVCYKLGDLDMSLVYLKEGLNVEQTLYGVQHPNSVVTLLNIAKIHRDRKNYACAFVCYSHAHAAQLSMKDINKLMLADTLFSTALMLYRMKEYSSAFEYYQDALLLQRQHYGDNTDNPDVAATLNSIAIVLFEMGKIDLARSYFESSLKIRRKIFGSDHPDVAINLFNLATLHHDSGDSSTAAVMYHEALVVERKASGPASQEVMQTLQLLGLLHQQNGELADALIYFQEALDIERKRSGNNHVLVGKILNLIGNIHLQRGNVPEMMKCFVEASKIYHNNHESLVIAGYNYYCISKLHPECAEAA